VKQERTDDGRNGQEMVDQKFSVEELQQQQIDRNLPSGVPGEEEGPEGEYNY